MTTIEIFDFVLDSTFDKVTDWLDYFQDDYETSSLYYFIKTLSETEGSAIYYYLCHDKKLHEQTQNNRNYPYFTLLPDEKMVGLVRVVEIQNGVRIIGSSEEGYKDTDPWNIFISVLEDNYPGRTKYIDNNSKVLIGSNDQTTKTSRQTESSKEDVIDENENVSSAKTSREDEWGVNLVVEINKLKNKATIEHPLQYDYYAIARWNHHDDLSDICGGILNAYGIKIGRDRLVNRMSELRKQYPQFEIIKRNEIKS